MSDAWTRDNLEPMQRTLGEEIYEHAKPFDQFYSGLFTHEFQTFQGIIQPQVLRCVESQQEFKGGPPSHASLNQRIPTGARVGSIAQDIVEEQDGHDARKWLLFGSGLGCSSTPKILNGANAMNSLGAKKAREDERRSRLCQLGLHQRGVWRSRMPVQTTTLQGRAVDGNSHRDAVMPMRGGTESQFRAQSLTFESAIIPTKTGKLNIERESSGPEWSLKMRRKVTGTRG
ncbi:hypothetical protein B0H19DRAFT_1313421 [Mycena capillaripes]|nr:hypothetical protein B0H19DRAFT_1313421 [Mycena capillaripes]